MKIIKSKLTILSLFLVFLQGCSGYHVNKRTNPFVGYGIKHITIPMFYNRSNIAGVSAPFTKEFSSVISTFPDIRVTAGNHKDADAVMIGVIDSSQYIQDTVVNTSTLFLSGDLKDSIGNRNPFYVATNSSYDLSLRVMIIRRPTKQEIELVSGDLGSFIKKNSKIVFDETYKLTGSVQRVLEPSQTSDTGGVVNFTRNLEVFKKSVRSLAVSTANSFREVVLNAF
ncbi:putative lipoprotein [Bacteriovorax sp. BSW11_IV]|uniref:hypothetical protein n=1 Tax=Bacteriovorax sp. BSW11_IV TaxID=1353529 RepID=UPI00038A0879|nr:hypothetical protein [Bacteriovorax sp. BSW11_IV]EQC48384.1 putative lipoprotein [Bacteriovorax sp. BSW11_IV]